MICVGIIYFSQLDIIFVESDCVNQLSCIVDSKLTLKKKNKDSRHQFKAAICKLQP
ncbi:hypothetical protein KFK09_018357 [Dendrobium nobile]|uniref:Uncharacterized protein n=1 Tax=Dendrobium nobile TaxID=94219 RepID=A0A8T3AVT4_DENNO|nr:hypothetical protein KFK09_018357 [Dendrobium nobile]